MSDRADVSGRVLASVMVTGLFVAAFAISGINLTWALDIITEP